MTAESKQPLAARILVDLKEAMKAKDEVARDTLRMLKSEFQLKEVELGRPPKEEELQQVLKKGVKARKDSARQYEEGGRSDLAEKELAEAEVIAKYLPAQLSSEEAEKKISELVQELGITEKKDMGKLMQEVMKRFGDQIDGRTASGLAAKLLS